MNLTFEQYVLNPMGRDNAVLNARSREIIRVDYQRRFDNLMLRENGKVEYHLFKQPKSNVYWAYIKVPSEVVKNFYYDVVIKFIPDPAVSGFSQDLLKYNVKFFSNDPAFVYTYAHVFAKNKLFIEELNKRMSRKALHREPKEKNPGNNIGYVKSLYFAYLILKNKGLDKLKRFEAEAVTLDLNYLLNEIEDADTKIEKRQEEGSKISRKKKVVVDKSTAKQVSKYIGKNGNLDRLAVTTTKKVGKIQNKSNSSIKSVRGVKTVKKI